MSTIRGRGRHESGYGSPPLGDRNDLALLGGVEEAGEMSLGFEGPDVLHDSSSEQTSWLDRIADQIDQAHG